MSSSSPTSAILDLYMLQIIIQFLVLIFVVVAAFAKSLRLEASRLSEFELRRRVKAGDNAAQDEATFRAALPQLDALRRVGIIVLISAITLALMCAYSPVLAAGLLVLWLVMIELLSVQTWLGRLAQKVFYANQPKLIRATTVAKPFLQYFVSAPIATQSAAYHSRQELLAEIDHDKGILDRNEKLLVHQALAYRDILVKDIMTPRTAVITVAADDTIGPLLLDRLHHAGHSRYPVIHEDLDHVQGVLHMRDLVLLDPKSRSVADVMDRRVYYVHQDRQIEHALQAFLHTKHHILMVVNEFEEVMGIVTIEDVLEAIIGRKIGDEFDQYDDMRAVSRLVAGNRRKPGKS